ncbi:MULTISPECIES: transposase-like zinc-binding domain-containing protein [Bacteria]|uniref:transposase-like zinc-binding domain-containing protein n=1 Tax=Bacteria TaxID=2 RepID=UPI003AB969CB
MICLKKCFFCGAKNVVLNGLKARTQRYKCKDCERRFDGHTSEQITCHNGLCRGQANLGATC